MSQKDISINFSALAKLKQTVFTITVLMVLLIAAIIGIAVVLGSEHTTNTWGQSIVIGILGVFVFWGLVAQILLEAKNTKVLEEFAHNNGFTFGSYKSTSSEHNIGSIFQHGHNTRIENCITGKLPGADLPFNLYTYYYSIGSGRTEMEYDLQIMELELPRKLPQMVIDSTIEVGNGNMSTLPIDFDASQKIELEGDFHKYFDLYAPDKYGISLLTIVAPDVMEVLLGFAANCDVEIVGNRLYIYWPIPPKNKEKYEQIFNTAQEILAKTQTKLIAADIFSTKAQALLATTPSSENVYLARSIFRKYAKWIAIAAFVSSYFLGAYINSFAPLVVCGVALVIIGYSYFHKQSLRKDLDRRFANRQIPKSH